MDGCKLISHNFVEQYRNLNVKWIMMENLPEAKSTGMNSRQCSRSSGFLVTLTERIEVAARQPGQGSMLVLTARAAPVYAAKRYFPFDPLRL